MSTASEAQQLRAQGVPITTLDGRQFRLIFDVDALALIEEDFGSLGGMQDALERIRAEGATAQFFTPVLKMMRAALAHDPAAANARFDTALIGEYYIAVMKATDLAFPKDATPVADPGQTTLTTLNDTSVSPGESFTTLQPSVSVGAMPNSGG